MKPVILVVEDNPDVRAALVDLLSYEDYRVLSAGNGLEALDVLEREIPVLIVTDLRMPIMDGRELIAWVQSEPPLRHTSILVLSADETLAREVGRSVSLLRKPVELGVLLAEVRALVFEGAHASDGASPAEDPRATSPELAPPPARHEPGAPAGRGIAVGPR